MRVAAVRTGGTTAASEPSSSTRYAASLRGELHSFLNSSDRLVLPQPRAPQATVVVITWNRAELVLACLRSIVEQADQLAELVVVDNASTDETSDVLDRLDGATVLRNHRNEGFLLAANRGAATARGQAIIHVNSDTVLQPTCLRALVEAVSEDGVGAAGGRLLDVTGRLQEAGAMIRPDGTVMACGAGDDPAAPRFGIRRIVDYCSGALLAVDAAWWHRLGGFDPAYVPAYYEDVDLCLRLGAAEQRVVYEPAAVAVHVGFASGNDRGAARRLADRNRARLIARHGELLRRRAQHGRLSGEHLRAGDSDTRGLARNAEADAVVNQALSQLAALKERARAGEVRRPVLRDDAEEAQRRPEAMGQASVRTRHRVRALLRRIGSRG